MGAKHLLNLLWKGPGVFPSLQGCALMPRQVGLGPSEEQGGTASRTCDDAHLLSDCCAHCPWGGRDRKSAPGAQHSRPTA